MFTLVAAGAQTARNAMQRELTGTLGTVGATHVRFLFGFPFAVLALLGIVMVTGLTLPKPNVAFWAWNLVGAVSQIFATGLMLA
ncbi:MAG: EamA/RhaT family transporter, partial [Acetobacteraceae bacterium]|nr:EamA/RhaT family transporter [Acetobacteraceae bacterium]